MKTMRWLLMCGALWSLSCLPPDSPPADDVPITVDAGEQVSASTPDGQGCHQGTFECADGPEVTSCGTWSFDVNESGGISGHGQIVSGLPGGPVDVVLSGVIDQGTDSYDVVLTSEAGGSGQMELEYDGPTLNLVGSWSFTDGPEPTGNEIDGGITGTSCVQLP